MYYIDCPNRVGDSYEKINRSEIRGIPSSVKSVSLSACTGAHCFCILVLFWSSIVFCLLFLLFYVIRAPIHTEGNGSAES